MASSLLGNLFNQPDQLTSLLGQYYSPAQEKTSWLGGTLQGIGAGIASGRPGAWATMGTYGGGNSLDAYRQRVLAMYGVKQRQDELNYQHDRDKIGDARWAKTFALDQAQEARAADDAQRQADLRTGQQNAVTNWMNDQNKLGANILPGNVRAIARAGGVESALNPLDEWRYNNASPYVAAKDYGNAFAQIAAQPPVQDPYTLGPGQVRYSGNNVPLAEGPPKTPDTLINNNMTETADNAYLKKRGEANSQFMADIEKGESSAFDTLSSIQIMQNAMQDPNFYSGWGGQAAMVAKQFLGAMGGDPNAANSAETFNAESKRLTLASMGGSLGPGFSNADRDFVTAINASLDNTPAGNKTRLAIDSRIQQRKIQIAQMARDYASAHNGVIDDKFKQQLSKWAQANPLFPEAPKSSAPTKAPGDMSDDELMKALGGQ